MLSALGILFVYISGVIPSGRLAMVAAAGLFSCAAVIHCGLGHGFLVFTATAIASFLIAPDKGNVLLYAVFFGYYPVLKSPIEHIKNIWLCWAAKLVLINVVIALLWHMAREILLLNFPIDEALGITVQLCASAAFVIYDIGLSGLISTYINRVASKIKR